MPRIFTPSDDLMPYTIEGQIATLDRATAEKTRESITINIDGENVTVPRAVIARDADRNPITDESGKLTYRYTTIYEAMIVHLENKVAQQVTPQGKPLPSLDRAQWIREHNPIPILCHQEHLAPAAVCRMCVVEIRKDGRPEATLSPACHRIVDKGIEVRTRATSPLVAKTVQTLANLLMADQPAPKDPDNRPVLHVLAESVGAAANPVFPVTERLPRKDDTSYVIDVDHNACILCDACIRSCTDVKHNNVIGRTGRGFTARIGFDFDDPMGESSCVACGECAASCPTDALTFAKLPEQRWEGEFEPVELEEVLDHPLFQGVSRKFLDWNKNAMVKRRLHADPQKPLCREGDFGNTAYLIQSGKLQVSIRSTIGSVQKTSSRSWLTGLLSYTESLVSKPKESDDQPDDDRFVNTDSAVGMLIEDDGSVVVCERGPADVIIGEMTCMNNYPRAATVTAIQEGTEVIEIMRNVLYVLQRNKSSRVILDELYRARTFPVILRTLDLFADLRQNEVRFDELAHWLQPKLELFRVNPGHVIFRQGDPADHFYIVRLGYVRFVQEGMQGDSIVRDYYGPGRYFGEIGLLTAAGMLSPSEGDRAVREQAAGRRTLTCSAVDHVELVRVHGDDFLKMCKRFPEVRTRIEAEVRERMSHRDQAEWEVNSQPLSSFLDQGLQNAQNLLVLDLESCTRCDECTKACSDSHEGVTRLIREGLRYDKYLVASSCRSCQDPVCMIGCPVNSIHRSESLEIRIEDWCIGCGLCASNCPYGNINMHPFPQRNAAGQQEYDIHPVTQKRVPVLQYKATTCDTCHKVVPRGHDPNCVYACPHDAAHRMTGAELLSRVRKEQSERRD